MPLDISYKRITNNTYKEEYTQMIDTANNNMQQGENESCPCTTLHNIWDPQSKRGIPDFKKKSINTNCSRSK